MKTLCLKKIFFSFTTVFLISCSYANRAHGVPTLPQLHAWYKEKKDMAYRNKLRNDAFKVVGPVIKAHTMSEGDRERSKKILLATQSGTPLDVKKVLEECNDHKAVIDLLNHVYHTIPSKHYYTFSDTSLETLVSITQKLGVAVDFMAAIYQLADDQREALIDQLKQQKRHDVAEVIAMIGSMSEQELLSNLIQLNTIFKRVKRHGVPHLHIKQWHEDCSFWLTQCAHALDSTSLPSAKHVKEVERNTQDWTLLCNELDQQVRLYDIQAALSCVAMEHDLQEPKKIKQELSELLPGLNLLGADEATTGEGIRTAYKRAAVKYHPDKKPEGSEEKFIQLGIAKEYKLVPHSNMCRCSKPN